MFFRNVGRLWQDYMVLYPRKQNSSILVRLDVLTAVNVNITVV
jgi:hypothetical protein